MSGEYNDLVASAWLGIILAMAAILFIFVGTVVIHERANDAERDIDRIQEAICEQVKDVPAYKDCVEGWR